MQQYDSGSSDSCSQHYPRGHYHGCSDGWLVGGWGKKEKVKRKKKEERRLKKPNLFRSVSEVV